MKTTWLATMAAVLVFAAVISMQPSVSAAPQPAGTPPMEQLATELRAEVVELAQNLSDDESTKLVEKLNPEVAELHRIEDAHLAAYLRHDQDEMSRLTTEYQDHFVVASDIVDQLRAKVKTVWDKMQPTLSAMTNYGPNAFYATRDPIFADAPAAVKALWFGNQAVSMAALEARFDVERRVRNGETETRAMVQDAKRAQAARMLNVDSIARARESERQ